MGANARWPDCATGWHDRCTRPTRCGCPCHTKSEKVSPKFDNQDDLFAAYVATYGPIAADDPVLLARAAQYRTRLLAAERKKVRAPFLALADELDRQVRDTELVRADAVTARPADPATLYADSIARQVAKEWTKIAARIRGALDGVE